MKVLKYLNVNDIFNIMYEIKEYDQVLEYKPDYNIAKIIYHYLYDLNEKARMNEDDVIDYIRYEIKVMTEKEILQNYYDLLIKDDYFPINKSDFITSDVHIKIKYMLEYHNELIDTYINENKETCYVFRGFEHD